MTKTLLCVLHSAPEHARGTGDVIAHLSPPQEKGEGKQTAQGSVVYELLLTFARNARFGCITTLLINVEAVGMR